MDLAPAYDELCQRIREASLLESCSSLLGWDERTLMPPKGAAHRGEQVALLARLVHERRTDPKIGELLAGLQEELGSADPFGDQRATLRELRRTYDRACKLPQRLVEELARASIHGQQVWQEARKNNDFKAFLPALETIVALKREEAQAIGYENIPYDALLDEYEPGARTDEVAGVFAQLQEALTPIVVAIQNSKHKPKTEVLHRDYPVDAQRDFAYAAAGEIGFDFEAGRLDVTTHPFCSGIGPGDVRLTTRYNPKFFNEAFFGTLHEAGHGIYEQGLPAEHFGLPLGTAVSLGIHESQSRFWENQVGRGRAFWEHYFPRAQKLFPQSLKEVSLDDFHFAINEVTPSFIRVEADEVTYNLHIILRFELEQALISGDLQVADVPQAWNERFNKLFQMTPPSDAMGCLQDIHWSGGGIGYFPTYALGNLYAAQFMEQVRADLGDVDADFRRGEFGRVKRWLNEKVHAQGSRYPASALCEHVTGRPLSPEPFLKYIHGKYASLYPDAVRP